MSRPKVDLDAERDRFWSPFAEQQGADVPDDVKLFNTAQTERALAMVELRPIAHCARLFFDAQAASRGGAGLVLVGRAASSLVKACDTKPTPESSAALQRAKARFAR